MKAIFVVAAAVLLSACQTVPDEPPRATAALQPTKSSKAFGEATFEQVEDKVRVIVFAQGLKPNQDHAFRIHEVGDCASGDGMSTRGVFNPHRKPSTQATAGERQAGVLPVLKAGKDGRAKLDAMVDIITVGPGPASIVGRGLIIHADPDDKTPPAGNPGARIACGVIKLG